MAGKETEQILADQKLAEVKKEMALLRAAIKKQEQQALQEEKQPEQDVHQPQELFAAEHKVIKQDILVAKHKNPDKEGTAEQHNQLLDVSPGDHTVVEL